MLRPSDVSAILHAAAHRRAAATATRTTTLVGGRTGQPAGRQAGPTAPGVRRAQSLPSDPTASGTGINPWWRYQEQNVPGGGHVMVNVGTGNMLLQDDDMSVPHKGIALAFRRTYNSQLSAATNPNQFTNGQSLYGNGWTNTFDAHVVSTSSTGRSVYDIDGARYEYILPANWTYQAGEQLLPANPSEHATLAWDGGCGWLWTKKSGTTYHFYATNPASPIPSCLANATVGGYSGRLFRIIGRNSNTYITFTYSWDNGDASANGKISQITAQTESGLTATLGFADFSGRRLLQTLVYPDNATAVYYAYDASGNLTSTGKPANNAAGTLRNEWYGYQTIGADTVMHHAASPRWASGCASGCGSDGNVLIFGFSGQSAATSALSSILHRTVVNPTIPDGTGSTGLQPGYPTTDMYYLTEYFTTGVTTPTFRDTDGHMTNWVVDGLGRPTQTQECTASVNQGQQCVDNLHWLLLNESWDASNNLVSEVDARGYETDYAYDGNGNAIAVAAPQTATSQGTFRPTKLYDYDAFNNVVAYCDESETHQGGGDWASPPAPSDSLCSSLPGSGVHWRATLTYPAYQPYGQLASMTTPMGYSRRFTYAPANQAGTDFGLPTAVAGDPITQRDGSTLTPAQTLWYDGTGNLRCYSKGNGTYVLSYDALGRLTSEADPDDSSANAGSACGKTTGQPGWNTQTTSTYYPDGSKQSVQAAAERPYGVATSYTYDMDGNVSTELDHHGCTPSQSCSGATTQKWYDGGDRLVEVALPADLADSTNVPWLTRYIYDLSQGGTVALSTASFQAYGNLYKTQELIGLSTQTQSWTDTKGNAFDALDRSTAKYSFSPSSSTTLRTTTSTYDHDASTLGVLWQTVDPLLETSTFTYNQRGAVAGVTFGGDGGVTAPRSYVYDADGRVATRTSTAYGTETLRYDDDGRTTQVIEPNGGGVSSAATIGYAYYGDGSRASVGVTSAAVTASPLMTYDYRADGRRNSLTMTYAGITSPFTWTYTDAGRELTETDPYTGMTVNVGTGAGVYPGSTLRARTSSYDTTGQLSSLTLPGYPNWSAMARDPEGSLLSFSSITSTAQNGTPSPSPAANFTYSTRGEATGESEPDPSGPLWFWQSKFFHGLAIPTGGGASGSFDPVNAALLQKGQSVLCSPTTKFVRGGVDALSYDAAGRVTGRTITAYDGDCQQNHNETQATSYDAENHTIGGTRSGGDFTSASMAWGPNGHPITAIATPGIGNPGIGTITYHYDGDQVLFVSDSQGRMLQLNAELLASAAWTYQANPPQGSNALTVWDRDYANTKVSDHNATGYDGWSVAAGAHPSGGVLARMSSTEPIERYATPSYQGAPVIAPYVHPDGFEGYFGTVQGVRVSNDLGVWTSPDAYAGDVHDPMSQKPYMWNRNNPYEYSDPSGYQAQAAAQGCNAQCMVTITEVLAIGGPGVLLIAAVLSIPGDSGPRDSTNANSFRGNSLPATGPPGGAIRRGDSVQYYDKDGIRTKRVDLGGAPHGGVAPPHVQEYEAPNTKPDGTKREGKPKAGARKPTAAEESDARNRPQGPSA